VLNEVVVHEIATHRALSMERYGNGAAGKATDTSDEAMARAAAAECMLCLSLDGEQAMLVLIGDLLVEIKKDHPELDWLLVMKHPAACSMSLQPLDVSPCFKVSKQVWPKLMIKYPQGVREQYMAEVDKLLAVLQKPSRLVFARWLSLLPQLVSQSFTISNVRDGWRISGLHEFDLLQMLSMCTVFSGLSDEEQLACVQAILKLSPYMLKNGQVTDAEIRKELGGAVWVAARPEGDESGRNIRLSVDQMALNRRRALIISHEAMLAAHNTTKGRRQAARKPAKVSFVDVGENKTLPDNNFTEETMELRRGQRHRERHSRAYQGPRLCRRPIGGPPSPRGQGESLDATARGERG
jgi:hypothetical protein